MIRFTEKDGAILFNIRLQPRASKTAFAGEHDGALKIRIAAPPVDNAANEACTEFIAKALGVSKTSVSIASGATSKNKVLRVDGLNSSRFEAFLKTL
ncbi:MAG: DUF167 domain-containing protein [Chlorobiales bacterium]|jgi:uncharacterized protein|nr:DUF167 domain-containing protein [Chlorobiales bacterium]